MKKTKIKAILNALMDGKQLTVKSCMHLCGTHKLTARIIELEEKYNFKANRKWMTSKSRYGGVDRYMSYSLSKTTINYLKKKI